MVRGVIYNTEDILQSKLYEVNQIVLQENIINMELNIESNIV